MSQLLQVATRGGGSVPILAGILAPAYVDQGIPFDDDAVVAVEDAGVIDHHWQGLPFTVTGRLAIALDGVVDRVESSAPFSDTGHLVFGTGAVEHYSAGIPYTITGQIKAVASTQFNETNLNELANCLVNQGWSASVTGIDEITIEGLAYSRAFIDGCDYLSIAPEPLRIDVGECMQAQGKCP